MAVVVVLEAAVVAKPDARHRRPQLAALAMLVAADLVVAELAVVVLVVVVMVAGVLAVAGVPARPRWRCGSRSLAVALVVVVAALVALAVVADHRSSVAVVVAVAMPGAGRSGGEGWTRRAT